MKQRTILLRFTLIVAFMLFALDRVHAQDVAAAGAISPEKFVLSVKDRNSMILKTLELYKGKIKTTQSKVIELDYWTIRATALTFRKENNILNFDLYYGACQDLDEDWTCDETIQSMIRMDSNLNSIFQKDLPTLPNEVGYDGYDLVIQRLQQESGISLRLLRSDGINLFEQKLHRDGSLGLPANVGVSGYYDFSAAEDGKMIATIPGNLSQTSRILQIRPFHPNGPISRMQTEDVIWNLALTGPVTGAPSSLSAGSLPVSNRFLFFIATRFIGTEYMSRVMKQKINNSTGKFIGTPKPFTEFKIDPNGSPTVAVTAAGNIVLYTEWLCGKKILKAQVFNPQTGVKVGPVQTIIGCDGTQFDLNGINVTRFQ